MLVATGGGVHSYWALTLIRHKSEDYAASGSAARS
jgi:hypothetical protein